METRAYYEKKILDDLKSIPDDSLPNMYNTILNAIDRIKRKLDKKEPIDFCGKWQDERTANEIIEDIYSSRTGYASRLTL